MIQIKQIQINKDNIHKNIKILYHKYKVGDKFMIDNNAAYKYETPYNRPFVKIQYWTNITVALQYGATQIRHSICSINTYTSDTNVEDITTEKYV